MSRTPPQDRRCIIFVVLSSQALAQDDRQTSPAYPTRTISIICPSPGGGVDVTARIVGTALAQTMNATVMVDPRPAAGGNVASEYVARAPADGYCLVLAPWIKRSPIRSSAVF
jgi:tripartite-type tricarboxylate transporter receptor subunit TctC